MILTPATLTVAPKLDVDFTQCNAVRTLNFEVEKFKNWRDAGRINGYPGISLSLWNNTLPMTWDNYSPFNKTFFDYWTGSSWQTEMAATLSAYSGKAIARDDAALETCGSGWNCSYSITFTAPGYKCDRIARGRGDNTAELAELKAPFNTDILIPDGENSYLAHTTLGDYSSVQIEAETGGIPKTPPPFPKNLGAFRTEPILWIGYSDAADPKKEVPLSRQDPKWNESFIPTIIRCEHYVTNYKVQFNHTYSDQVTTILQRDYLRPIVNTTFVPGVDARDGTKDNVTATPESNYVMPLDVETYRLTGAYHSLGSQLRSVINGSIQYTGAVPVNTQILKTGLISKRTYLVMPNFQEQIQTFYQNMMLSLLSNPQFVVVTWAANSTERSGWANATELNNPRLKYPCIKTRQMNDYAYNARDLWLVYAFAVVSAVASVFLGTLALAENNNHVRDTRVSSIVAATRAHCLEDLPWASSQWGEVPQEIREVKMGYGMVAVDDRALGDGLQPGGGPKVMYGFAPAEVLQNESGTTGSRKSPGSSVTSVISRFRRR